MVNGQRRVEELIDGSHNLDQRHVGQVEGTFFAFLCLALTVILGGLQAHEWHEAHQGQTHRAPACLGRWGNGSCEPSCSASGLTISSEG